jgi:hypothetical protein
MSAYVVQNLNQEFVINGGHRQQNLTMTIHNDSPAEWGFVLRADVRASVNNLPDFDNPPSLSVESTVQVVHAGATSDIGMSLDCEGLALGSYVTCFYVYDADGTTLLAGDEWDFTFSTDYWPTTPVEAPVE